jgi:hypothetical protein
MTWILIDILTSRVDWVLDIGDRWISARRQPAASFIFELVVLILADHVLGQKG